MYSGCEGELGELREVETPHPRPCTLNPDPSTLVGRGVLAGGGCEPCHWPCCPQHMRGLLCALIDLVIASIFTVV